MREPNKTRRNYLKGIATSSAIAAFGTTAVTADSSPNGPAKAVQKLVDEHGEFRVGRGIIVSSSGKKIADTAGNRLSDTEIPDIGSVKLVQPLNFEDGHTTRAETELELSKAQTEDVEAADSSPSGSAVLVSRVSNSEYREEFEFSTLREKAESAREEALSMEISRDAGSSTDSIEPAAISIPGTISDADDGTEQLDNGIPIINSVGANYKEGDNRCGVAQRSAYLTVNSSATAEVFKEAFVLSDVSDVTVTFSGDILGVISSVGMGGYVIAEGFVRDTSEESEDSTLLMDANVGVAQLPYVAGGNVDASFGPDEGTVGDQPYLDYELTTDIQTGYVDIGVRMKVAFNGLKAGVTQTNFMPAKEAYQPPNLGTEFFSISLDT